MSKAPPQHAAAHSPGGNAEAVSSAKAGERPGGRGRTRRLFFSSFLLIQLRACCWGSMQRGKRLARVVRMPFWTESSSGGRPWEPHLEGAAAGICAFVDFAKL